MLKLSASTKFKRDYKACVKRGYNMDLIQAITDILRIPKELPESNKDHKLNGNYKDCRECHILPDWLLIYKIQDDILYLVRTGSHSDLFNM